MVRIGLTLRLHRWLEQCRRVHMLKWSKRSLIHRSRYLVDNFHLKTIIRIEKFGKQTHALHINRLLIDTKMVFHDNNYLSPEWFAFSCVRMLWIRWWLTHVVKRARFFCVLMNQTFCNRPTTTTKKTFIRYNHHQFNSCNHNFWRFKLSQKMIAYTHTYT